MAFKRDFQQLTCQSMIQGPVDEDFVAACSDEILLKKKLFGDEEDDSDSEDCKGPPESTILTSTARGLSGNLMSQFDLEESPICTPLNETSGMEWDLQLATPCKTDERQSNRRRRALDTSDTEDMFMSPPQKQSRCLSKDWSDGSSPINTGLQQLHLFDTPHTPKSIIRRSSLQQSPGDLFSQCKTSKSRLSFLLEVSEGQNTAVSHSATLLRRKKSRGTNINPFTPQELQSKSRTSAKQGGGTFPRPRSKKKSNQRDRFPLPPPPLNRITGEGLALKENNISRYNAEFHEVSKIGSGQFGTVYKCINRLDGCTYAVKKSRKPVAGSADEAAALREVYAHAVIGSHEYIVRYFSAWAEDNHMIIQNEFCNGGNLADKLLECKAKNVRMAEQELMLLMKQIAKGLQHIHSKGLVHLDIKPENIFLCHHDNSTFINQSDSGICCTPEDSRYENGPADTSALTTYKIGDMGHVTSVSNPVVEEGDCRFLPRELLNNNYQELAKADIFSLGLTVYTAGSLQALPKNGDHWHSIRDGHLGSLPFVSPAFNHLLQTMVHPDPKMRPTSSDLLSHHLLSSEEEKSKAELQKELQLEKMINMSLQKELSRQQDSVVEHPRKRLTRFSSSVF